MVLDKVKIYCINLWENEKSYEKKIELPET